VIGIVFHTNVDQYAGCQVCIRAGAIVDGSSYWIPSTTMLAIHLAFPIKLPYVHLPFHGIKVLAITIIMSR